MSIKRFQRCHRLCQPYLLSKDVPKSRGPCGSLISLMLILVLTLEQPEELNLRVWGGKTRGVNIPVVYFGARPRWALKVISKILKLTLEHTGSQWRDVRTRVMWCDDVLIWKLSTCLLCPLSYLLSPSLHHQAQRARAPPWHLHWVHRAGVSPPDPALVLPRRGIVWLNHHHTQTHAQPNYNHHLSLKHEKSACDEKCYFGLYLAAMPCLHVRPHLLFLGAAGDQAHRVRTSWYGYLSGLCWRLSHLQKPHPSQ